MLKQYKLPVPRDFKIDIIINLDLLQHEQQYKRYTYRLRHARNKKFRHMKVTFRVSDNRLVLKLESAATSGGTCNIRDRVNDFCTRNCVINGDVYMWPCYNFDVMLHDGKSTLIKELPQVFDDSCGQFYNENGDLVNLFLT